jgi:hypothetical protein
MPMFFSKEHQSMSDRISNRRATERNVKKLRRFANSLLGDQHAADIAVLNVMIIHTDILTSEKYHSNQLLALLKAVYQNLSNGQSKSQNISLLNPLRSELVNTFVKFQSLDYAPKAIISLLLIEELSREKISQITEIPLSQIDMYILQSLKFLSEGSDRRLVSG